jgi:hypothetical protein
MQILLDVGIDIKKLEYLHNENSWRKFINEFLKDGNNQVNQIAQTSFT